MRLCAVCLYVRRRTEVRIDSRKSLPHSFTGMWKIRPRGLRKDAGLCLGRVVVDLMVYLSGPRENISVITVFLSR